jgi:peptidoglycan hydrolase CwlO-like protein
MTSEVQASRLIQRLRVDIENKEMEIMRVNSDIDWANDRIQKLEQALQQGTTELKVRSELVERSEGKIGEYQQKIDDLERYIVIV